MPAIVLFCYGQSEHKRGGALTTSSPSQDISRADPFKQPGEAASTGASGWLQLPARMRNYIHYMDVQTAQDSNGENSRRGGSNTTCFFHFEYLNRTHITEGSRSLSFFYEGRRKANVSPQFCCFIQQSLNGNQWLLQPLYKAYSLV